MSHWINKFEETVMAVLFAALVLVPFTQVIARYIFNSGATWALELTKFIFAWLIMFSMSYVVKIGGHIGVDAFVKLFSTKAQRIFGLLAISACLIYVILLLIGAVQYFNNEYKYDTVSEDLEAPLWIVISILPIGLVLLFYRFGEIAWRIISCQQIGITFTSEADQALAEEALTDTALDINKKEN